MGWIEKDRAERGVCTIRGLINHIAQFFLSEQQPLRIGDLMAKNVQILKMNGQKCKSLRELALGSVLLF